MNIAYMATQTLLWNLVPENTHIPHGRSLENYKRGRGRGRSSKEGISEGKIERDVLEDRFFKVSFLNVLENKCHQKSIIITITVIVIIIIIE